MGSEMCIRDSLLSDAVLSSNFKEGQVVIVDVVEDKIVLRHADEAIEGELIAEALPAA